MRLIDADEVKMAKVPYDDELSDYEKGWNDAVIAISENAETVDAVAVVRCKDCDWWDRIDDGSYGYCHSCKHGFYSANWEISIYRRYKEDFFCADGERRADE